MRTAAKLIAILAIAFLLGVAWRYGIITTLAFALWAVIVWIWNLLYDIAKTFVDVVRDVLTRPIVSGNSLVPSHLTSLPFTK